MAKVVMTDVDRAGAAVRRGIDRLIQLLGGDQLDGIQAAGVELSRFGSIAVIELLGAALPRARSPHHRRNILLVLGQFAPQTQLPSRPPWPPVTAANATSPSARSIIRSWCSRSPATSRRRPTPG